jgi:hypothetical protein
MISDGATNDVVGTSPEPNNLLNHIDNFPEAVAPYSHSIVQRPHNTLFLLEKQNARPHFSRQPYRQKFGLLFSLGNFERWKISPIAVYRQQPQRRLFVLPRTTSTAVRIAEQKIPSEL